ncbi:MAG TPA: hypothetical protein PK740_01355 [Bacteroidales bacterium]|nr:hypothetical protein [Bacteroidales bacterium]
MYNIELEHLTLENAQMQILHATENLCDTFKLSEHFGTLSFALHETVNLMERFCENQADDFSVNFYIDSEKISTQIIGYQNIQELSAVLSHATLNDAETSAFTVMNLVDNIEFRNNQSEIWMEFHVKPTLDAINRSDLLKKEIFQNDAHRKETF